MKNNALNRALFILLLSSFIGIILNPEILAASDSVVITDLDSSRMVKTIEIDEPKNSFTIETIEVSIPESSVIRVEEPKATTPIVEKNIAPDNMISFAWGSQTLVQVSSTVENSGTSVAQIGRLLYGHNYTDFGNITKLKAGDTFIVKKDGTSATYRVAVNPINSAAGVILDKKGNAVLSYAEDKQFDTIDMNALINYGMGHSLTLMTCYGTNSRYVVVADVI